MDLPSIHHDYSPFLRQVKAPDAFTHDNCRPLRGKIVFLEERPGPVPVNPTPYTLHPTPYTLRPAPFTLHPTPYILHATP
jgi:hypothetical protein